MRRKPKYTLCAYLTTDCPVDYCSHGINGYRCPGFEPASIITAAPANENS